MNISKTIYHKKSLSCPVSLQKIQSVPVALFKLCHLVQLHDHEAFSRIDEMWSTLHVLYVITAGQARLISAEGKLTLNAGCAVVLTSWKPASAREQARLPVASTGHCYCF
ncbi:hypothetical protein Q0F98_13525 [Paenibacillus amylolyticus]|nr:hypothetical protein Q0F98_13525 [Paenibacillus amylolyticus]